MSDVEVIGSVIEISNKEERMIEVFKEFLEKDIIAIAEEIFDRTNKPIIQELSAKIINESKDVILHLEKVIELSKLSHINERIN